MGCFPKDSYNCYNLIPFRPTLSCYRISVCIKWICKGFLVRWEMFCGRWILVWQHLGGFLTRCVWNFAKAMILWWRRALFQSDELSVTLERRGIDSNAASLFVYNWMSWQIVRRLRQPLPPWSRIFDELHLQENSSQADFLSRLALPDVSKVSWMRSRCHTFITEELGTVFLSLFLILKCPKSGKDLFQK